MIDNLFLTKLNEVRTDDYSIIQMAKRINEIMDKLNCLIEQFNTLEYKLNQNS